MARASAGARLHFGFCNLSLSHERLYGALGVGLVSPRVVVDAEAASTVSAKKSCQRWSVIAPMPSSSASPESAMPYSFSFSIE